MGKRKCENLSILTENSEYHPDITVFAKNLQKYLTLSFFVLQ
jgi:4-aminobutyrate aminotransferase-like enzyme